MEALVSKYVKKEVREQIAKIYEENRRTILIAAIALGAVLLACAVVLIVVKLVNRDKDLEMAAELEEDEETEKDEAGEEEEDEDLFEDED